MLPSRNTSPLPARSVLASVLLGTDPPWLPTALLVRTTALFGISEGATRTALSRMVARGEAAAERGGYRLVGRLVARQQRQTASRLATTRAWDGTWELATIDGDVARSAADRAACRDALAALRLVELREGAWGRPDNLDPERAPEAWEVARRWCTRWSGARPDASHELASHEVIARWDLPGWSATATALQHEMSMLVEALEAGDTSRLAVGFVTSAAVLRHLQADPLLPAELLPTDWPGQAFRRDYDRFDAAYRSVLRTWFATAR